MTRAILLALTLLASGGAASQDSVERAGTWELGIIASQSTAETLSGDGGSSADIDGAFGLGAVGGYNLTNRFAVLTELAWSSPDYTATLPIEGAPAPVSRGASIDLSSVLLKGVFYFSEASFTPYLELGAGWTFVDTNAEVLAGAECWYDPWLGFVCADDFEAYQDTRFSYSTGFGVRWDLNRETLLKVSWSNFRIDTDDRTEDLSQDVFRAEFSWKF